MNPATNPTDDRLKRLHFLAEPMADLLTRLLDWGREHTGPTQPNSPHELLIEASNMLDVIEGRGTVLGSIPANLIKFPALEAAPPVPDGLIDVILDAVTADWEPEAAPEPAKEYINRETAIRRIKDGLQKRTGRTWSVTGGKGTAYGWLRIDAPPKRRIAHTVQKPGTRGTENEDYDEVIDAAKPYGHMTAEDRKILTEALGLAREVHHQGESIPAGGNYYLEYVDRAEGREPRAIGAPYWD
jgi:hypothetical protein